VATCRWPVSPVVEQRVVWRHYGNETVETNDTLLDHR